jgi:hypothetical protein
MLGKSKERNLFVEEHEYIRQRIKSLKMERSGIFLTESLENIDMGEKGKRRLEDIALSVCLLEEILICVKPKIEKNGK